MQFHSLRPLLSAVLLIALLQTACKEPFTPEVDKKNMNLLVVEGNISDGTAPTTVRLSRTAEVGDVTYSVETNALVWVEDEQASRYYLPGKNDGTYTAVLAGLSAEKKYRLRIQVGGSDYASEFVTMKRTPPIDQVGWVKGASGVSIGVSTHDSQGSTRYYRWEYSHTWEFRSPYISTIDYQNRAIVDRPNYMDIYKCWKSENSTLILIGSSASLSQDVIKDFRLLNIPANSWQLSVLYSVLVRQYAMSEAEYKYWQKIKKNTEEIGSIFDPQPSEIPGNVKCLTRPEEQVLGFVGASVPQEKRIFISADEVRPWHYQQDCAMVDVSADPDSLESAFGYNMAEPLEKYITEKGQTRYTGTSTMCVDCTLRGTNIKPSFWP